MTESIIQLRNLTKRFDGGTVAVRNLDLDVIEGEFLCFLGPSGCGKTTTLRMIVGLETPTSGEIFLRGERITDWPPQRRNIGIVFQNYALFGHMSVYENLAFAMRIRGQARERYDGRVRQIATELQLGEVLEVRASRLDLSTMQRVAMARTLLAEPQILLLDEPLNNFDPGLREGMRAELKRWQHQFGTTMIYVTHDQEEALTLGDRILVMRDGEVEQLASPMEIYRRPQSLFVASFIGRPAMNLLTADMEDGELQLPGGVRLDLGRLGMAQEGMPARPVAGIRPEHLVPSPSAGELVRLEATVDLVRPQAAKTIVDLRLGHDVTLQALVRSPYREAVGARVAFGFDPHKVVLFNADSGRSIG